MSISTPFEGWIASLSDGTQVFESDPNPGEISAWQRLLKRCRETEVSITSMKLVRNGSEVMAMPKKMCSGYFQAREAGRMVFRGRDFLRQGIGSVIGEMVFITWVDLDTHTIYQDIRPLRDVQIHTSMS
jgi:hypothetical protein